ncbi:MAG: OsmC family protein [Pyrinomonadaceae bacterium]|nr:OsmC family protein [Pyrinomonadaceae bacterium]MCX7639479.1 OsmC family protein [Pyrinomonadaceae bacterium]MDW8304470.1 OsmC family protein [Acidobacteriota bacterium]
MRVVIEHQENGIFEGKFSEKGSIKIGSSLEENPTPMQLILLAAGTCSAIDVVSILHKKRQQLIGYRIEVEGQRRKDHPRAFSKIHIHHVIIGKNISEKAVADAIRLSDEKYCSVVATLRPTALITTSYQIIEED